MKRLFTVLSGLLLAATVVLVGCGKSDGEVLATAKSFIEKRDFKSAAITLKSLLQKQPESGEARFLLGKTLLETGDAAGAEAELERALEYKFFRRGRGAGVGQGHAGAAPVPQAE